MNKNRIDKMIPKAKKLLEDEKIADNNVIERSYRSGVSSFGAAVAMGSLISAAAFFSAEKSNASYDRKKLGRIIAQTAACYEDGEKKMPTTLYEYVNDNDNEKIKKDLVLDAAVAVKLAMNLFELRERSQS